MSSPADKEQPLDRSLDLRERDQADGGLTVDLFVEGERVAYASVGGDALTDMKTLLGTSRADLRKQLETALMERLERDLVRVRITTPVRTASTTNPDSAGRLASQYVYDVGEKIEAGVTWYDVASDVVGPASAPPLVRHRMRLAARRLRGKAPGALRVVLDILDQISS